MKVLRNLSILMALLFAMGSTPLMASPQSGSANDGTLTVDMLADDVLSASLAAEQDNTQMANGAPYVDMEVAYVIRELTVASDVSFLGFDCAILPASSSAKMTLDPSSTEQVNATPANRRTFTAPVVADNNLVSTEQSNNLATCDTMNSAVFDTGI
jgi:hypothetical protein